MLQNCIFHFHSSLNNYLLAAMGDDKYKKRVNLQLSSAFSLLCVEIYLCNDLKNFINKMGLINLKNQYAAIKTIR